MDDASSELTAIGHAISSSGNDGLRLVDLGAQWFGDQVSASRSDPVEMAKWARSTVIDDNVPAPVFDEQTFFWLHGDSSGEFRFPIGHAGLMHVYSYLLARRRALRGLHRRLPVHP